MITPDEKLPERDLDSEDLVEPENALPTVTLAELPEHLREAAARASWSELMPVQSRTIPYILARRDLMVQSRTGSGKTGAFILPTLERIDPQMNACQALVLVPTRELAKQVSREAEILCGKTLRTIAVYGGVGYGPQIEAFKKGAHIVIGTPGRILDHLLRHTLSLDNLEILIFDEADRMLSMGFYPDMKRVKTYLPRNSYNGYMFSATFPPHVMRLAGEFLNKPEFLSLSSDRVYVAETEHVLYNAPAMEKDRCLVRIIETENPTSALVFCNTKATVDYVTTVLQRFGYDADRLTSDLSQSARERVLGRIKKGELRFLVATDVAARGIDIIDLSHVIQYEPPEDPEGYIHRAGRTGRAGARGEALTLVSGMERLELKRIAKRFDLDIQERSLPTPEDVETIVSQRVVALLESALRSRDSLRTERMQRFIPLARSLGESDDLSGLIAMLLDDFYQATLHKAPERPAETPLSGDKPEGSLPKDYKGDGPPKRRPRRRGSKRRKR